MLSLRAEVLPRLYDHRVRSYRPVRRVRHLAAYGNTNMYRPVINIKKRGGNGEYTIQPEGFPNAIQAKLATTVIVKTMDSQWWSCRTHLFQPVEAFSITTFDPLGMASWVLRHRTD